MAKKRERTELKKSNWTASFDLVGKAVVNDYTFQLDQHSEKSDWVWDRMNLMVDCGDKYGRVSCSLMGGFGINRENFIYVHGKDVNGKDDFSDFYTIDYNDRFNENILRDIGNACFRTVALELDTRGTVVTKRFLSQKDMIEYIADVLEDGTTIYVRGNLNYSVYNDNVTVEKDITYIGRSVAEEDAFRANFRQSILLDSDCMGEIDKDKQSVAIDGYVLEKFREYNGYDLTEDGTIKGGQFVPLMRKFEYSFAGIPEDKVKKALQFLFKIKRGSVNQITFIGHFEEASALVKVTEDDIPDDIKSLIDIGIMTMEEAMTDCVDTTRNREYKMVIERPHIRKTTDDDGESKNTVQIFKDVYDDEDLDLECLHKREDVDEDGFEDEMNPPFKTDDEDDSSWLDEL